MMSTSSWGLSPRMRGNQYVGFSVYGLDGSIPAHAGEPERIRRNVAVKWPGRRVYPRACGGTIYRPQVEEWVQGLSPRMRGTWYEMAEAASMGGLSPRMRGNHKGFVGDVGGAGSIPAHAGEPKDSLLCDISIGVYPRACGGTVGMSGAAFGLSGLSPRMRGNHDDR